jgi:iron complex outermembrane recepter protein
VLCQLLRAIALVLLLGAGILAGESTGSVRGVLRDQDGGIVQGARVEIRTLDSSLTRSTVTDGLGRYAFEALPAGRYQVSADSSGFATSVRTDVAVTENRAAGVDLVLNVAGTKTVLVVTAPKTSRPLVVETDPRAPRQPIPAHDGGDYLKNIPGFSIIRKGGSDGDPVLRGMAGSRLSILMDGQQIFGGCGGRMDPPTAYVFPAAYDRITVLKGPETVLHGPDASAGAVLFDREIGRAAKASYQVLSSFTVGGYGRHDEMMDARAALPSFYVQAIATRSHSGDYKDGSGNAVHSFYTRWSGNLAAGWTPGENTLLEVSVAKSNGEAAYADRPMDGSRFARDNVALRFERKNLSSRIAKIEAQTYYNYIDHVMDNYNERTPGALFSAMNPDRQTMGGRFATTFVVAQPTSLVVGVDAQRNIHRGRSAMGTTSTAVVTAAYLAAPRVEDMRFNQTGFFAEATHNLTPQSRLIGGFRGDWREAVDSRPCVAASACPGSSPLRNQTLGMADTKWLKGGFGRFEKDIMAGGLGTFYAGVGHAESFPDYWERLRQDPITLNSAFLSTRPEKTTQFDSGMLWKSSNWTGSVSGFYGKAHDYILMRWSPAPALTRNVNATTMGAEGEIVRRLARNLKADAMLSYVRANNETDGKPLAQQPPLEGRVGLQYEGPVYAMGAIARLVARQNRVDIGSGNIVMNGMDLGPTAGFAVFSLNGGYRMKGRLMITGGIDNLLDRTYAEHLSRGGAMVPGFVQMWRINEPGRMFWLKVNFDVN